MSRLFRLPSVAFIVSLKMHSPLRRLPVELPKEVVVRKGASVGFSNIPPRALLSGEGLQRALARSFSREGAKLRGLGLSRLSLTDSEKREFLSGMFYGGAQR